VETETSIESVWELIEYARHISCGSSLNGEYNNVSRAIFVSETSVYSLFNQLLALECVTEFSFLESFKLYVRISENWSLRRRLQPTNWKEQVNGSAW